MYCARRCTPKASPDPVLDAKASALQGFGDLRTLPIALPAKAKTSSCTLLNEILADSMILYSLYKKHHWLVAGPTFYQLHLLFDKHADEQLEIIDVLAERVAARPPDGAEEVSVMIDRTLRAHETIITKVRKGIKTTETSEDWGTNDVLMSDVLRRHELQVWFLAEHVVDVPVIRS